MKLIALPKLYRLLTLKVPVKFSRLDTLENLLSGSDDGLQYTRAINILTQQAPLKSNAIKAEQQLQIERLSYVPVCYVSDALNTLIRLLILRLPKNRLMGLT